VRFQSPFVLGAEDGETPWQSAAELGEIPLGGILRRQISGRDLLLSRTGEAITCFTNACAHLAMPLDDGEIADGVITCRRHGFQYLLATGECLTAPAVQLEQHAVRLIDSRVEIRLSR
jgi:nitrite reductase/ring-hydroxylating ferredoxin subunit